MNVFQVNSSAERLSTLSGDGGPGGPSKILVVGAGTRFLSAMSYYTIRLANALTSRFVVAAIPMRQLLPTFMYPGRSRVGSATTQLEYSPAVNVLDGVDWYWGPGFVRTLNALRRWRPEVVIFEWWTGTVLHSYLVIALLARLLGASVVVEFHEVLDTSEEQIPLARAWVRALGLPFFRLASGFVVHSDADREPLERRYRLRGRPCMLIPHGPFDHHVAKQLVSRATCLTRREAPPEILNLFYFGIIRQYKGVTDLIEAFGMLDDEEANDYWLTIVGEVWEDLDRLSELVDNNRHRNRITLVNRFVDDDEVRGYFASADAVVLPYHRSSASGPAHIAMSSGLPLVVTAVGGLPAAVADYEGAILVPSRDPTAMRDAIRQLHNLRGRTYKDPHSWERTVSRFGELMQRLRNSLATRPSHPTG